MRGLPACLKLGCVKLRQVAMCEIDGHIKHIRHHNRTGKGCVRQRIVGRDSGLGAAEEISCRVRADEAEHAIRCDIADPRQRPAL